MKFLFICGSLEPGEDGVGDYTRRLAGELVREGHKAAILAFYDKRAEDLQQDFQLEKHTPIAVMRIPTRFDAITRHQYAKNFINIIDPEWFSLQFVPYSYHSKGLPVSLGKQLRSLGGKRKWHIMFHELWGGLPRPRNFREALLGLVQKTVIKKMCSKISPLVVSTSIPYYKETFFSEDIKLLPLFGNIGFEKNGDENKSSHSFVAVHFGGFSGKISEWELQLNWVKRYSLARKQMMELWIIGEGGVHKERALAVARKLGVKKVKDFGWLSAKEVSCKFQEADIGISRAGTLHYGKSSSTISMLEHGLPVILQGKRQEHELPRISENDRIYFHNDNIQQDLGRGEPKGRLSEIAKLFVDQLE